MSPSHSLRRAMHDTVTIFLLPDALEHERSVTLGKFINGLLVGVGVGMLVAPKRGEEMRRLVGERTGQLWEKVSSKRSSLPGQSSSNRGSTISNVEEYQAPTSATGTSSTTGRQTTDTPSSWSPGTQSNLADPLKQSGQGLSETTRRQSSGQSSSEINRSQSGNQRRNP